MFNSIVLDTGASSLFKNSSFTVEWIELLVKNTSNKLENNIVHRMKWIYSILLLLISFKQSKIYNILYLVKFKWIF